MKKRLRFLKRFARKEDGQILVEFAIAVPLVFTLFLTSVEMGLFQIRQMFLDRGLDMTVRAIRLNTGAGLSHNQLKSMVCEGAGLLEDCETTLRLEMTPVDPRAFTGFGASADCIDTSQPATPLRQFIHGGDHSLMLVRACYMFKPVFPTTGMGAAWTTDGSGRVKMISMSAFVQEPS